MVMAKIGEEVVNQPLRLVVRFDYRGANRPKGLFFSSKNVELIAEETRDNQVALLRNVPVQGVQIENIDTTSETYTIFDEEAGMQVAYAPALVTIRADMLEDVVRFILREEFRKLELLEPDQILFNKYDLERFLFKVNDQFQSWQTTLERRNNQR